jgi:plasmid stability protein
MPNLSVKDVPESWAEALRQRAARNHRSLQGELMSIIEQAVREAPAPCVVAPAVEPPAEGPRPPRIVGYDPNGWPIVRQGWMTPEQLFADMETRGRNKVVPGQPLGVDIIREARDSR